MEEIAMNVRKTIKTCQYGGLTILGVEGVKRLKAWDPVDPRRKRR